ncbi:hypothetical protein Rctr85_035 [Virus Rctr85]|nr:hypothetical protein Rctr85_035 [Virus Rctr85]
MNWDLVVHEKAEGDIMWLKAHRPEVLRALISEMKRLAVMRDPRKHKHVQPMRGYAQGWYRLALYKYNFRVVFRLLHSKDSDAFYAEIWPHENVPEHGELALEVIRAAFRSIVYDSRLRLRDDRVIRD